MVQKIQHLIDSTLGISCVLEKPRDKKFGHFALPTFNFAKTLKKSPQIIAQEFAQKLESLAEIKSAQVVNGYVNISLSDEFLALSAWEFLHKKGQDSTNKKGSILLEFVSANPTGPLHIGHARGAVFGDALARIGRHIGYNITTEYYINDAGSQIQNLGRSIYFAGRHLNFGENYELPDGCYKGEYVLELAVEAKEAFSLDIFSSENDENIAKLSLFGKDKMLQEIKENLADANIFFDFYVSEKEVFKEWDSTLESLKNHNGVYEEDGKLLLKSSVFGDEFDRVIVRQSGEPTYLAGDITYHRDKYNRNFDHYINIWGADHHGYITRVKAAINYLGFDSQKLEVLLSQMVALLKDGKPYKMSKRAGNFVLMKDVLDEVGADALRLVFLSKRSDTHLEFDVETLTKEDSSNPVFYINYAHARIHTLFAKSSFSIDSICKMEEKQFVESLSDLSEDLRDLLVLALGLEKVLNDAFNQRLVNKVVDYLRTLAAEFHRFYNETKILGTKDEEQILKVLIVVADSIALGLDLLGIKAKVSM